MPTATETRLNIPVAIRALLLLIGYSFVAEAGYLFVIPPEPSSHFWPAAGLSLAVFLLADFRRWPVYGAAIFGAEVAISLLHRIPLGVSLVWASSSLLDPVLGTLVIRKLIRGPFDLTRPGHLIPFLSACILTPAVGAAIAAAAAVFGMESASFFPTFRTWWFAISLSEIVVTPVLISSVRTRFKDYSFLRYAEGLLLLAILVSATETVFAAQAGSFSLSELLLIYLLFPLFVWALLRFGILGSSLALFLVNLLGVFHTIQGTGPFSALGASHLERLIALQSYLSFVNLSVLALASFLADRRRIYTDLRDSERRLSTIIENSRSMIYVKDLEGRYFLVNRKLEKMTGLTREQIYGKTDYDLVPREYADLYTTHDRLVLERDETMEFEEGALMDHHQKMFIAVKFPLRNESGRPYALCGMSTDITALKDAIQLRDDFISIASHELRTPLTPLKMQIELLRRHLAQAASATPKGKQLLSLLKNSDRDVARMIHLVENLLDVSRMSQGKLSLRPETIDLGSIVASAAERYRAEAKKAGSDLQLNVPSGIVGRWDPLRIEQLVINLVSNAIKYGPGKPIEIRVVRENDLAILSVRDRGIGISEADQSKIFDRFERAVPITAYAGLGLGLYIVQQIVRAHEGSVRVESEPEEGAEFIVTLPLEAKSAQVKPLAGGERSAHREAGAS